MTQYKISIPFRNMPANAWRKLGIFAVVCLYSINYIIALDQLGLFNGVGGDFLAYWSVGKIANSAGFPQVFDVNELARVQFEEIKHLNLLYDTFQPIPAPYFPAFLAPFKLFAFFDSKSGYWIWSLANLALLIFYTRFFYKQINGESVLTGEKKLFFLLTLLSFPVYSNFIYGQIEVFLVVFTGEFIRNTIRKKEFLSGLWLGLLLIKPQLLLLIVPALLIKRTWKILSGFSISVLIVLLFSILLVGTNGLVQMFKLWLVYAPGEVNLFNSPNGMANWRMLGSNINLWTSSSIGWAITGLGMLISVILWVKLCQKKYTVGTEPWIINMFSIFSISSVMTWHSQIHMGMALTPFLILFSLRTEKRLAGRLIDLWVFSLPIALLLGKLIAIILLVWNGETIAIIDFSAVLLGVTTLILYVFFSLQGLHLRPEQGPLHDNV